MSNLLFLKRSYKTILFFALVVLFFFGYNFFLIDRSLINLKIALAQAEEANTIDDFRRISSVLKLPVLKEVFRRDLSSRQIISLELAENSARTEDLDASKSINYYLKEAIRTKEAHRSGVFNFFDNINAFFLKPSVKADEKSIKAKIKSLNVRAKTVKDKASLQEIYYDLADCYGQLEDYPQTKATLLKAIEIDPISKLGIKSRFNLGWIYKVSGQTKEAVETFTQLAKDSVGKDNDFSTLCRYQVADAYYKQGDFLSARNAYANAVNNDPGFKSTDLGLLEAGNISLYKLGDIQAASAFFEAFDLYQKGKDFSIIMKEVMERIKRSQEALEAGRESSGPLTLKSISAPGTKSPLIIQGEEYKNKGFQFLRETRYSEAVATFQKAQEIFPRDGVAYVGSSLGYFWLKLDKEALADARKALDLAPLDEVVVSNAMFVLINLRYGDEAVEAGERLIKGREIIKKYQVYYNLGYAYVMVDRIEESMGCFRKAMRLNREFVSSLNNLAAILWTQRKFQEATTLLSEATSFDPGYADGHYNLGAIYYNMRRMEEAYRQFELVLDIDPDYKDVKHYMETINNYLRDKQAQE